ncbi:NUDIX hydrolase [Shimia abyssi]|uniref:8-oxo-dGTP pyrophosphatase MutT (NUDIX family) n=1 Tax=Shimia abyssi TaxID=1662395 RepID=A0A2P8F8W3_9RHOB|nr:NUDIX hydrolase [Shimia abyssi]PSL18138.1 8-oxo-dGTP pyrophosphatase MutT (NUDIX family) [Shimia abyssi]
MTVARKEAHSGADVLTANVPRRQVAALCVRNTDLGARILLITSRDTGRWVLPKGWIIKGLDEIGSAQQEAWEEAGVRKAKADRTPVGTYHYDKRLRDGTSVPVQVSVFKMAVKKISDEFPEMKQRNREWFPAKDAARLVDEPELKQLLRQFPN